MKMKFAKNAVVEFDTAVERKRIAKSFDDDPTTRDKLYELMDAFEANDLKKCIKLLKSKWWHEYDKKLECSRLEFTGMVETKSPFFDRYIGYVDMIFGCHQYPEVYSIERVVKEN